jgi:hypothetical protein
MGQRGVPIVVLKGVVSERLVVDEKIKTPAQGRGARLRKARIRGRIGLATAIAPSPR